MSSVSMEGAKGVRIMDRRRWNSVVLSIATGLMMGADGLVSAGESTLRLTGESTLLPIGTEPHPPSFRKRPVAEGEVRCYMLDPEVTSKD